MSESNTTPAAAPTPGQTWWLTATRRQKVRLMREMGFGDYRVYAGYRWEDFTPHSRAEIDYIIGARKSRKSRT